MVHGRCQRGGEVPQKVCVGFRDGHAGTESRQDRIVSADGFCKFGVIQRIALLDGDAIAEWLEPLGRANKCGDGVTLVDGLANDLDAGASGGAEYDELHELSPHSVLSLKLAT